MKIFIVIDEEAAPKNAVYSVHLRRGSAIQSQVELNQMVYGGRITTIIEETISDHDTPFIFCAVCGCAEWEVIKDELPFLI